MSQYNDLISPQIVTSIRPTTTQMKFKKKLKGSLLQVLIGFVLFNLSFVLLFFNERRSMKQLKMLEQAFKAIVVVDDDRDIPENQFILVSDDVKVDQKVKDQFLNADFTNLRKLSRIVEMYQNIEIKTEKGEQIEYSYQQEWKSDKVDSSGFNDQSQNNNHNWIVVQHIHENPNPKICNIELSDDFIRQIDIEDVVQMRDDMISSNFNKLIQMNNRKYVVDKNYIYLKKVEGQDTVGDIRVIYKRVKCGPFTVAGQYQSGKLVKYNVGKYKFNEQQPDNQNNNEQNQNGQMQQQNEEQQPLIGNNQQQQQQGGGGGDNQQQPDNNQTNYFDQVKQYCGLGFTILECICQPQNEISWVEKGVLTKDEFYDKQKQKNSKDTNGIRKRGFMFMVFGMASLFAPIIVILESVPYIQPYLGLLGKYAIVLYSLIVSIIFSVLTIVIARLTYDPTNPVLIVLLILTLIAYWKFRIF